MNIKFIQSTTKQVRPDKNLVILESTEIKYDVLIKKSQDYGLLYGCYLVGLG
jgi:NADH dehydrogenase FAD-containing subunit